MKADGLKIEIMKLEGNWGNCVWDKGAARFGPGLSTDRKRMIAEEGVWVSERLKKKSSVSLQKKSKWLEVYRDL